MFHNAIIFDNAQVVIAIEMQKYKAGVPHRDTPANTKVRICYSVILFSASCTFSIIRLNFSSSEIRAEGW